VLKKRLVDRLAWFTLAEEIQTFAVIYFTQRNV